MGIAKLPEGTIDRVVRDRDAELLVKAHDEIARPPAHDAVDRRYRTFLNDPCQKSQVHAIELGWRARRWQID